MHLSTTVAFFLAAAAAAMPNPVQWCVFVIAVSIQLIDIS